MRLAIRRCVASALLFRDLHRVKAACWRCQRCERPCWVLVKLENDEYIATGRERERFGSMRQKGWVQVVYDTSPIARSHVATARRMSISASANDLSLQNARGVVDGEVFAGPGRRRASVDLTGMARIWRQSSDGWRKVGKESAVDEVQLPRSRLRPSLSQLSRSTSGGHPGTSSPAFGASMSSRTAATTAISIRLIAGQIPAYATSPRPPRQIGH